MRSQVSQLVQSFKAAMAPLQSTRCRRLGPSIASPTTRFITTTPLFLKKAKATTAKRSFQKHKEEDPDFALARYEKQSVTDLDDVLEKTKHKMTKALDWAKSLAYEGVDRGRGRISPGQ